MHYRYLGRSEVEVSTVAMGCWAIVGDATWGEQDERDALAAIDAALEVGMHTFDTAELYGDGYSEELLGRALEGRREKAVILTKASKQHCDADSIVSACEGSLRRLRSDYIDLYQVHWPNREVPFDETMAALERLREQGKIRAVGVSNFGSEDLPAILETGRVESNQLCYSLLFRAIEQEIQPLCLREDVSILCYSPLAQGLLTGKFRSADEVPEGRARTRLFAAGRPQARHGEAGAEAETFAAIERVRRVAERMGAPMADVALAWLLHQPGVSCVLAGARNAGQAKENAAAADLALPDYAIDELTEATDALKQQLGPNPDMWQSESRLR
jgi:aryl-alcohol dehydrogenase-like predicted oxidoreductase